MSTESDMSESWTVYAPTPFGRHPISSHDTEAAAHAAAAAENSTSSLRHFVTKDPEGATS